MLLQKAHNEVLVLTHLLTHPDTHPSTRQIAKSLAVNYRTAHQAVANLEHEGAITVQRLGNRNVIRLSGALTPTVYATEYSRTQQALTNAKIQAVYRVAKRFIPFSFAALFGSYAKGSSTKHSDIDLCFVSDDTNTVQEVRRAIRRLPLPVELHVFTSAQILQMLDKRSDNIAHHIRDHHILLTGTQAFFEVMYGTN